ncbi:prepilin-type N-terminal cleavage/methylation domain-containing protein [bacterium]|nr:prepilin-type N-terminal cleavage/methylation domain-containing protein [bacterium]
MRFISKIAFYFHPARRSKTARAFVLENNNPHGFTLFEIIVVMGIIAIVAALIVPRVGNTIYNMRLRSAVRQCSAVLRYTRSMAITTQKEQRVSFFIKGDPEEKDYYNYNRVTRDSSGQSGGEAYDIDEAGGPDSLKHETRKVEMDSSISLRWRDAPDKDWKEEGRFEVIFSQRGIASGGEIRFALFEGKRDYILSVDPVTGRAKILAGEG